MSLLEILRYRVSDLGGLLEVVYSNSSFHSREKKKKENKEVYSRLHNQLPGVPSLKSMLIPLITLPCH